jgi:hypothetical protein
MTTVEVVGANPEEPAIEAAEVEPTVIMPPASATRVAMSTVSATSPSVSTLVEQTLQPAAPDVEFVPTVESPRSDLQEPVAPEDAAGGISPVTIREVRESSGARPFSAMGLLAASPEGGERILDLVRSSWTGTCVT